MKKGKIILSAICLLAVGTATVQAQQTRHEITFGGGGGISSLEYKLSEGSHTMGWGGNFGAGYTFFFHPQWGVGTGVEMAFYNAKAKLPQKSSQQSGFTDEFGDSFILLSDFNNYEEKQRATYLNIPLMVQFQTTAKHKFYAAAGVKFGIPLSGKYEGEGSYDISGYYPQYSGPNSQFIVGPRGEEYPIEGFGSYQYQGTAQDLSLKLAIMASVEAGVKWQLSDRWALYTGLYFDYGFNDIYDGDRDKQLVSYNNDVRESGYVEMSQNSILGSSYSNDGVTQTTYADKLNLMAAGLKVKISFGAGKMIAERQKKEAELGPEAQAIVEAANKASQAADKAAQAAEAQKAAAEAAQKAAEAQIAAAKAAVEEAKQKQVESNIAPEKTKVYTGVIDNYATGTFTPLTAEQKAVADSKIELLKKEDRKVMLVGHACNLGSTDANYSLGLQRAKAVKAYMVEKGIAEKRISVVSKGDTEPLYPNDTEANRKLNRRVDVIVY